jgi:hypothetical protein
MKFSLRLLYLYLFSAVGLIIIVVGCIQAVDLTLKTYIFPDVDNYESAPVIATPEGKYATDSAQIEKMNREFDKRNRARNRQQQLINILSMLSIGLPLYLYHWRTIQKENSKV